MKIFIKYAFGQQNRNVKAQELRLIENNNNNKQIIIDCRESVFKYAFTMKHDKENVIGMYYILYIIYLLYITLYYI